RLRQGDRIIVPAHWATEVANALLGGAHSDRISIPPSQSKIVAPCWVTSLHGSLVKSGSLARNVECREGQPRSYRALMWPLSQSRITEKRNLPSAIASTMKT